MANAKEKWSKSGSFMKKPKSGWLHGDEILVDGGGVCYMVKYLGCISVLRSMRTLQFEVRSQVTREATLRVLEASGLKPIEKKRKVPKNVSKALGAQPMCDRSGTDINLTISIEGLELCTIDPPEMMANHTMPSISFASSGEGTTSGMIAYVAKDPLHDRACHVLDCRESSQEVIATVGQAFELRYKSYLNQPPVPAVTAKRFGEATFDQDAWGSGGGGDHSYQGGDMEGSRFGRRARDALPATPQYRGKASDGVYADLPEDQKKLRAQAQYDNPNSYLGPRSRMKTTEGGIYDNPSAQKGYGGDGDLYDNADRKPLQTSIYKDARGLTRAPISAAPPAVSPYDTPNPAKVALPGEEEEESLYDNTEGGATKPSESLYDNPKASASRDTYDNKALRSAQEENMIYDNKESACFDDSAYGTTKRASPFHMGKIGAALPAPGSLEAEHWFHGQITRQQAESLLEEDGEFLVRESASQAGQYVLTGMQGGKPRHMLLVDPEGVVRTKDRSFDSVQHLINHHRENNMPIVSNDSTLTLIQPVISATNGLQ